MQAAAEATDTQLCSRCRHVLPMNGLWSLGTKGSAREGDVMLTCKPCSEQHRIPQPRGLGEAAQPREEVKEDRVVTVHINRGRAFSQHKTVGLYNKTIARGLAGFPGYEVPGAARAFSLWRQSLANQMTRVPDHGEFSYKACIVLT